MMAPSLCEAGLQTPVEALDKADGIRQDLIYVFVCTKVLTAAGVELCTLFSCLDFSKYYIFILLHFLVLIIK